MSSGAGIQELMAAETRASQIVAEARIGESEFWESMEISHETCNKNICCHF